MPICTYIGCATMLNLVERPLMEQTLMYSSMVSPRLHSQNKSRLSYKQYVEMKLLKAYEDVNSGNISM